jgi:hypothetical protein
MVYITSHGRHGVVINHKGIFIMNKGIDNHRLMTELQELYQKDTAARTLLDWAAGRTNDAAETSIDRLMHVTGIGRSEAVELSRIFDEIGCGEFVIGRKGWKSRIRWQYSLINLGEAAQGRTTELKKADPELTADVVDQQQPLTSDAPSDRALTIAEAKRGLAAGFGVAPESIDITIRG